MTHTKPFKDFKNDALKLYHGTSSFNWKKEYKEKSNLFLTKSYDDAKNYAYEVAMNNELNGLPPKPIVCIISLKRLKELERKNIIIIYPDWGGLESENMSWEESLDVYSGISIHGRIGDIKNEFKILSI